MTAEFIIIDFECFCKTFEDRERVKAIIKHEDIDVLSEVVLDELYYVSYELIVPDLSYEEEAQFYCSLLDKLSVEDQEFMAQLPKKVLDAGFECKEIPNKEPVPTKDTRNKMHKLGLIWVTTFYVDNNILGL